MVRPRSLCHISRTLQWDPQNTIRSINSPISSEEQFFTYDDADRLINAIGSYGLETYYYDANGNRTGSFGSDSGQNSYVYQPGTNKITSGREQKKELVFIQRSGWWSRSGGYYAWQLREKNVPYSYDAAGNITQQGDRTYEYGPNNRLVSVYGPVTYTYQTWRGITSHTVDYNHFSYVHNGRGERTSKTVNAVTTQFFYDQSGNLIGEYDASGNVIREHVYGATGRLATATGGGNIHWHHNDHLGTPQAMTDATGTVVWKMSQTPFGIATVNEDPDGDGITVTNNFRFPGQYYDAETGLFYNYFRSYDPIGGRYTQADPIGLNGGMNTYAYVGGNPMVYIDPFGLYECSCVVKGGKSDGGGTVTLPKRSDGSSVKGFIYSCECKCKNGKTKRIDVVGGSDNRGGGNQFPHGGVTDVTSSPTGDLYEYWTGRSEGFSVDTEEWFFPDSDKDIIKGNITEKMDESCGCE